MVCNRLRLTITMTITPCLAVTSIQYSGNYLTFIQEAGRKCHATSALS